VKTVHLLRHAKAETALANNPSDHLRPLTKKGRKAAEAMAAYLGGIGFKVDRVFCSTAVRARETLAALQPVIGSTPTAFRDRLYLIDTGELLNVLKMLPDTAASVLLVGHNPTHHELAVHLIGQAPGQTEAWENLKEKFSTGALCSISLDITRWGDLKPRSGILRAFVRPKDLGA
jgi:phosphohistidine phosphatase